MLRTEDILSTLRMFQDENLDVRTVTMGINLMDCAGPNIDLVCRKVQQKVRNLAGELVDQGRRTSGKYGIPIVNYRIAVTPVAIFGAGHASPGMVQIAHALDAVAEEIGIDFVGGFSAFVQKACTDADLQLIEALPEALSETNHLCGSMNVASSKSGINMDAILLLSRSLKALAERTANRDGFGCAKFVVFANMPDDNPFMAGATLGVGEAECVINVGVSGPGVVKRAVERLRSVPGKLNLGDIAEEIKVTSYRVTRIGELIGNELAQELDVPFGIVDLSLAPTPRVGDSVGEIFQMMGIREVGVAGSTAALALLTDAIKKGGAFASSSVGGLSGAFIPVAEDSVLARAVEHGFLTIEKLEAMTSVCSVGLDMVPIPGDTSAETLAAIIADEAAIGVMNHKTTACRLIPVPGKKAGELAVFGGLFGESPIMAVRAGGEEFVRLGGRIPAPIHSLRN
ncbi:MAG: PFL family protein [Candidatus Poribacteria bacterium]|nr:PFL family protein [Candidatus Poribacteria bacterium]